LARSSWVAATVLSTLAGGSALALEVPPLRGQVTDLAGALDPPTRSRLEEKLQAYRRATGHEYAVLVVPALESEALEDYALRVAEAWQLGKKNKDDGLLLFVAMAERRVRVEVGYGLEGAITDAYSSRVIRNVIVPAFQKQDFAGGIEQGLDVLMAAGRGEAPEPEAVPQGAPGFRQRPRMSLGTIIFFVILFLLFLRPRRRSALPAMLLGSMLGGGFGGRRGGFGGGGGGFRGGGGRFGGGGASGGW
jgi:uncharacterized protein